MKLATRTKTFVRRLRRIVVFALVIVWETFFLYITVKRRRKDLEAAYRAHRQSIACRRLLTVCGVTVVKTLSDHVRGACLIVSNHLGILDGLIIASRFSVAFSGKAEMLHWPVAGWICRTVGLIPVDRRQRLKSASFADEVADRLNEGVHVVAFPEGTTVAGTTVIPFKTGAFGAVENLENRYVLPITIKISEIEGRSPDKAGHDLFTWSDPSQSLLRHFWCLLGVKRASVEIVVGEEISAFGRDRKELARLCHSVISRESQRQAFVEEGTS